MCMSNIPENIYQKGTATLCLCLQAYRNNSAKGFKWTIWPDKSPGALGQNMQQEKGRPFRENA